MGIETDCGGGTGAESTGEEPFCAGEAATVVEGFSTAAALAVVTWLTWAVGVDSSEGVEGGEGSGTEDLSSGPLGWLGADWLGVVAAFEGDVAGGLAVDEGLEGPDEGEEAEWLGWATADHVGAAVALAAAAALALAA